MTKSFSEKDIKLFTSAIRKNILDMAFYAGASSSHFGGALSISELISYLFSFKMNIDKKNPQWEDRDRFILSKGHACLAYYSALCEIGFISKDELKTFEKDDTNLLGHPVLNKELGIDFSNGSLGMGLSIGLGVAISGKRKKKNFKVYVVLGDGECNEGSVWEAAMAAPNFELNNLFAIVDRNNFQQTGSNNEIMDLRDMKSKWESFGWHAEEIDGHDLGKIHNYFCDMQNVDKPKVLIANTIKGKGFSFSEGNNEWHHAILTKKMYEKGLEELKNGN